MIPKLAHILLYLSAWNIRPTRLRQRHDVPITTPRSVECPGREPSLFLLNPAFTSAHPTDNRPGPPGWLFPLTPLVIPLTRGVVLLRIAIDRRAGMHVGQMAQFVSNPGNLSLICHDSRPRHGAPRRWDGPKLRHLAQFPKMARSLLRNICVKNDCRDPRAPLNVQPLEQTAQPQRNATQRATLGNTIMSDFGISGFSGSSIDLGSFSPDTPLLDAVSSDFGSADNFESSDLSLYDIALELGDSVAYEALHGGALTPGQIDALGLGDGGITTQTFGVADPGTVGLFTGTESLGSVLGADALTQFGLAPEASWASLPPDLAGSLLNDSNNFVASGAAPDANFGSVTFDTNADFGDVNPITPDATFGTTQPTFTPSNFSNPTVAAQPLSQVIAPELLANLDYIPNAGELSFSQLDPVTQSNLSSAVANNPNLGIPAASALPQPTPVNPDLPATGTLPIGQVNVGGDGLTGTAGVQVNYTGTPTDPSNQNFAPNLPGAGSGNGVTVNEASLEVQAGVQIGQEPFVQNQQTGAIEYGTGAQIGVGANIPITPNNGAGTEFSVGASGTVAIGDAAQLGGSVELTTQQNGAGGTTNTVTVGGQANIGTPFLAPFSGEPIAPFSLSVGATNTNATFDTGGVSGSQNTTSITGRAEVNVGTGAPENSPQEPSTVFSAGASITHTTQNTTTQFGSTEQSQTTFGVDAGVQTENFATGPFLTVSPDDTRVGAQFQIRF
ncbi:MAG: hypothetical protein AAF772_00020 [Acidobacteriota bacterium]